jgi:GldM N-terminal domain
MQILFFCFIIFGITACNNSVPDHIVKDFDSVNRSLKKLNDSKNINNKLTLIEAVLKKYEGRSKEYRKIFEMISLIQESRDARPNIWFLKHSFIMYCGDSTGEKIPLANEGSLKLTNNYFFAEENAKTLYKLLQSIKSALAKNTNSDTLLKRIEKIGDAGKSDQSLESFQDSYFRNVPPIAAITIINSFEGEINNIEDLILNDYLKKE